MRKLKLFMGAVVATFMFAVSAQAQDRVDKFGLFDHLSAGLTVGTTGIGIDVAAPLNDYLQCKYTFVLAQKQLAIYMGRL